MTFFERIKSISKRRSRSSEPVVATEGKGSKLSGAYKTVADRRPFFADAWRNIVKWLFLFIGLALFMFMEVQLAKKIIDLQIFLIIVFGASLFYAILFSKWPLAAFSLWIVISPLVSMFGFSMPQSVLSLTFDRLALFLPILILTVRLLVDRRKTKMPTIPEWLLLLHAIYIRIPEWINGSGGVLVAIGFVMAFIGGPICAYFILKSCLSTRKHIIWFTVVLMGMGVLWAISGFYEHYTGYQWASIIVQEDIALKVQDIAKGRAMGPGRSYPIYGLVLNLAFALSALFFGFSKIKSIRFFCFMFLPLIAIGIFFGYSKGAYISFAVLSVLMLILAKKSRILYSGIVVGGIIVLSVGYGIAMSDSAFSARMDFKGSLEGRTAMHVTAVRMFSSNPFFGVGYGNFSDLVPKYMSGSGHYRQLSRSGLVESYSRPHSEYLAVLAEQGLVGFVLYFGAVLMIFVKLLKLRLKLANRDVFLHDLTSLIFAFVVCVLLINLNDEFFKYPYMYYIIYAVFAITSRISELVDDNKVENDGQSQALVQEVG